MDLAEAASPQARLEKVEESVLHHHNARLASTTAEIHQAAADQQQILAALTAQVKQLSDAFSQMAMLAPTAGPLPVRTPLPISCT